MPDDSTYHRSRRPEIILKQAVTGLRTLIEERGGIKGRMGDLLRDPVSQDSVLGFPLISVAEFPGFPVSIAEAKG